MGFGASCGIATKIVLAREAAAAWAEWQAAFTRAAVSAPGFLSLETIPLPGVSAEWHVMQRFNSPEALDAWRSSAPRGMMMEQLAAFQATGAPAVEELAPDFHATTAVTEVITTSVVRGHEEAFQTWAARMQAAQALFPGYLGTLVQAPLSSEQPFWTTLVRFASAPELENWLNSPERQAELARSDPAVSRWSSHRLSGPFSGWFASNADGVTPAAWKQGALVLLVLFPVVMLELRFLSPLLSAVPMVVATFIGNALSVALLSGLLVRLVAIPFGWWLRQEAEGRMRREIFGAVALLALYLAEIGVFSLLF